MSWREDLTVGILRANRLFLGSASGYAGTELTATPAELNYLDTTAGTGAASKAAVLDSSGNYMMPDAGFFGMSADTIAGAGSSQTDAAALVDQINIVTGANGTVGVKLPAAVDKKLVFVINTVETAILKVYPNTDDAINSISANASISIGPGAFAMFVAIDATTWYCHEMATAALTVAELSALTGITATAAEINQAADMSGKFVADGATIAIDATYHGKTILADKTDGIAITLPAATGVVGLTFDIVIIDTMSTAMTIAAPIATDDIMGHAILGNDSDTSIVMWQAGANDNLITLGATQGGLAGTRVRMQALKAGEWYAEIVGDASGTEATPFSTAS